MNREINRLLLEPDDLRKVERALAGPHGGELMGLMRELSLKGTGAQLLLLPELRQQPADALGVAGAGIDGCESAVEDPMGGVWCLLPGSPAEAGGVIIPGLYDDLYGNPRPESAVSMGACQSSLP